MRTRGFTLIEVMIAIFIAAIMFAIGYSAINQALRNRDALKMSQSRVTEIQRGMRVIAQDFGQISDRPARDTSGTGQLMPAVSAVQANNDILLTFSRNGWSNPAGVQRPAEQRVRYRLIGGSLVREHWLSVDPALNLEPRQRVLWTHVKQIEIRYLDPISRQWSLQWPVAAPAGPVGPANVHVLMNLPLAIEFTVVFEDWGRVQRLFEVPA